MAEQLTYKQTMEYIEQAGKKGSILGLSQIEILCKKLGNPQDALSFVHIAGTNGKGSSLAYISTILKQAGFVVGRYISPTIFSYRERFQVNEKPILARELAEIISVVKEKADEMVREGLEAPTVFEIETAAGFLYFKKKGCDIVVLETGMGGDMDATNIVKTTRLCVFASISMDHMNMLGKNLTEIAEKKAGIMKPGCVCVSIWQEPEVRTVLEKKAAEMNVPIVFAEKEKLTKVKYGLEKQKFTYGELKNLEILLAGTHQIDNAVLAVEAILQLQKYGDLAKQLTYDHIRKGLGKTKWRARFEMLSKRPYFIMDGAHNEDAARRLAQTIRFHFTNKKIVYIMGVLKDKEYEKIIAETYAYAEHIITITPPSERALTAHELAVAVKEYHPNVTEAASIEEAIEVAYLLTEKEDVIIAFGSLSYLGGLAHHFIKSGERHGRSGKSKTRH